MYHRYWGKSNDHGYHLLAYHGLDTASVTQSWIDHNLPFACELSDRTALSLPTVRGLLMLFSALHDAGKFSVTFQNLRRDLYQRLQGEKSNKRYDSDKARHDNLGWMLWDERLRGQLIGGLKSLCPMSWPETRRAEELLNVFARIAFGHHGRPPSKAKGEFRLLFRALDVEAAVHYTDDLLATFLPSESMEEIARFVKQPEYERESARNHLMAASWQLAGMMVLCDWVASGVVFPFVEEEMPLGDYFQQSQQLAADIFLRIGLYSTKPPTQAGFGYLFPGYSESPTPLQSFCDEVELADGPQMWILEDVTGTGKTEAACTLISRMMKQEFAEGMFVALPTMATSNAMYERMAEIYHLFFAEGYRPSLVLSHGARHLSETFRRSYSQLRVPVHEVGTQYEDPAPRCSEWLADSTKKALLADVGIGTLDQVLLGALRVRFQTLRTLGMSSKVLVVDEVHAYDPYMRRVLENVLTHHAQMGLPVVLLSATLPRTILSKLCRAYHGGIENAPGSVEVPTEYGFPLVTRVDTTGIQQYEIDPRRELVRALRVEFLDSTERVYRQIRSAHEQGKCVCWIRNTIGDILTSYEELQNIFPEGVVDVFHSRFAMADRLDIEGRVCEAFGKDSGPAKRRGKVLLASQVVEQSLDLDFDVLISDLAPIDLTIQRAGRLQRHLRDRHGNRVSIAAEASREPAVFYVHSPPEPELPTATWFSDHFPKVKNIYPNPGGLWRTKEILKQEGQISLPDRARMLIEAVYGESQLATPEVFSDAEDEAEGGDAASRDQADFNTITFERGYSELGGSWDPEERVRTRLGEEQRTVYLARFKEGRLLPFYPGEYGWDLSAIKVRALSMQGEVDYPADWQDAIDAMRSERWIDSDALFLIVRDGQLEWQCVGDQARACYRVEYDSTLGLRRIDD